MGDGNDKGPNPAFLAAHGHLWFPCWDLGVLRGLGIQHWAPSMTSYLPFVCNGEVDVLSSHTINRQSLHSEDIPSLKLSSPQSLQGSEELSPSPLPRRPAHRKPWPSRWRVCNSVYVSWFPGSLILWVQLVSQYVRG